MGKWRSEFDVYAGIWLSRNELCGRAIFQQARLHLISTSFTRCDRWLILPDAGSLLREVIVSHFSAGMRGLRFGIGLESRRQGYASGREGIYQSIFGLSSGG